MSWLTGHVGGQVSALIDGQLPTEQEERLWSHVHGCAGCRRLVEHEGALKRRLASLSCAGPTPPPMGLQRALYDVDAWAAVDALERTSRRRRAVIAAAGAGTVGIAVMGLMGVTTPPAGRNEVPGPSMLQSDLFGTGAGVGVGVGVGAGVGVDSVTDPGVQTVIDRRAAR